MELNINLEPGKYVVAVSGGVDSMALLNMLVKQSNSQTVKQSSSRTLSETDRLFDQKTNRLVRLIVAHYDHGIRPDSDEDRKLVQRAAGRYGLPFVFERGNLGSDVSEAAARCARYDFLRRICKENEALAIITAHHQDDLLETVIINLLRGTGWRGLVSLRSRADIVRPLLVSGRRNGRGEVLGAPKKQLVEYAREHNLDWREDSTNRNAKYLRNYVRRYILPKFSDVQRQTLLEHIKHTHELREDLETELVKYVGKGSTELNRQWFIALPHAASREIIAAWLRSNGVSNLSSKMLERLVAAAKTFVPGRLTDVDKIHVLLVGKDVLALKLRER